MSTRDRGRTSSKASAWLVRAVMKKTMVLVRHSIEEAILLRQETDPGFLELKQHIRDLIHEEYKRER